jgi:hypothetical protein
MVPRCVFSGGAFFHDPRIRKDGGVTAIQDVEEP